MTWHVVGFNLGLIGIVLLIWSLLKQGVSQLAVALLAAGLFFLLVGGFVIQ